MIMRKTKHWLVTAALLLCSIVANAHDFVVDGIFYKITSNPGLTVSVTYEGDCYSFSDEYAGVITIPSKVSYRNIEFTVVSVGDDAFHGCTGITSVAIPESVVEVGDYSFYGCGSLTSVTLPESVTSIGDCAFHGCSSLNSISIPIGITRIEHRTFYGCNSLSSIDIPVGVTSLGQYAFHGCTNLTSITIPVGVTSLEDGAFWGCSNLSSIDIPNSVVKIGSNAFLGTTWFNKQPNGLVYAGKVLYEYKGIMPANTSIEVKEGTVGIANSIFAYDYENLISVTLPNSITHIGENAFSHCSNLKNINIPEGVEWIGDLTFRNCTSLASIEIPTSVTSIETSAFMNTAWFNSQPDGFVYLDNWLIGYKGTMPAYTSLEIKKGTKGIADRAFEYNENLYSVIIPDDVINMGSGTFGGCTSLTSVVVGNGVKNISENAFAGCTNLTSIVIGKGVTSIGDVAFCSCESLESLALPVGLISIGESAFAGCKQLAFIKIPNRVTNIGGYAFSECTALVTVSVPDGVTAINGNSFYGCSSLESVIIGDGVKNIGEYAFSGCTKLASVSIGDGLRNIGVGAFSSCESLLSLSFPAGLTVIGEYALGGCTSLESIIIPKTVEYIGGYAFGDCYNLASITCKAVDPPVVGVSETFGGSLGVDTYMPLYVPASSVSFYQEAECWRDFYDIQSIVPNHFVIADPNYGESFVITENKDCASITYTRTFNNTNWQALYVPFEIPYENIKDDFEVAYINDTRQYDRDDDGVKEETVIEAFKITSGTLEANYPYLIRAKEAGEKTITVTDAILYATEENSIDCSSVYDKYTFTGTYSRMSSTELTGCYALSGGVWQPIAEGATLGAFRFYLQVESRSGSAQAAQSIKMRVIGEETDDEATSINDVEIVGNEPIVYDLAGRRVANPMKGVYIVNGKKMLYN